MRIPRITEIPVAPGDAPVSAGNGVLTVSISRDGAGWNITAVNAAREVNGRPSTYEARITACTCNREACPCDRGPNSGKCRDKCHRWHAEKVLRLANRIARSYS